MIMDSLCASSPAGNETFEMFFEGIFRESPFSGFGMIQFTNESQNVFVDLGLRPAVADGIKGVRCTKAFLTRFSIW